MMTGILDIFKDLCEHAERDRGPGKSLEAAEAWMAGKMPRLLLDFPGSRPIFDKAIQRYLSQARQRLAKEAVR